MSCRHRFQFQEVTPLSFLKVRRVYYNVKSTHFAGRIDGKNKLRDHLDRLFHNRETRLHVEVLCIDPPAKDNY